MAYAWSFAPAALLAAFAAFLLADPLHLSPIHGLDFTPVKLEAPPIAPFSGQVHDKLNSSQLRFRGELFGPESLAFDPQGNGPYTGISDGRVVRWMGKEAGWETFATTSPHRTSACDYGATPWPNLEMEHICGRPLGLRFREDTGDLYIADAYYGLLVVGKEGGQARLLASEADGVPFNFTNDLAIGQDGVIYFTDTSTKYQRRQFLLAILEGSSDGRLLQHNPESNVTKVLLQGLAFPNGVALSADESFIVFCETTLTRLQRHWLRGPKRGTSEVFADLPGFPDNVRLNPRGRFWVAVHSKRNAFIDWMGARPWARRALLRLPLDIKVFYALLLGLPKGYVLELDESGNVTQVLEDSRGAAVSAVSEVEERDGQLWMGSVLRPHIAVYNCTT